MKLKSYDIITLKTWLSPTFIVPLARQCGHEVMGAKQAYDIVRGLIRSYGTYVRKREKTTTQDLEYGLALKALGYVGNFQPVSPMIETPWRRTARAIFRDPSIPGELLIPYESVYASSKQVHLAVLKAVSEILVENAHLNRALLRGRLYQRHTGHVLVNIRTGPDMVATFPIEAYKYSLKELSEEIWKATKSAIRIRDHQFTPLGYELMEEWAKNGGFVMSPGGATFSSMPGISIGSAALTTDLNGVPWAVTIGDGPPWRININVDHRVFDRDAITAFHKALFEKIERSSKVVLKGE